MADELIAVVRELLDELINVGNISGLDELLHPDFVIHTSTGDLDLPAYKEFVACWRIGIPDLYFKIDGYLQEGDEVKWELRLVGTHRGDFFGAPATGRTVDIVSKNRALGIEGRLVEYWCGVDMDAIAKELGRSA